MAHRRISHIAGRILLIVLGASVSAVVAHAQQSKSTVPSAEQEIVAASDRWFDALLRNDPVALDELEGDGFMIVQHSPKGIMLLEKTAQLKSLRPVATRPPLRRELSRVKIRRYENVAILTATATLRNETSTTPPNQAVVTEIWVNEKGRWRIVHFEPLDVPAVSAPPAKGGQ
jgi:hypothetical protein